MEIRTIPHGSFSGVAAITPDDLNLSDILDVSEDFPHLPIFIDDLAHDFRPRLLETVNTLALLGKRVVLLTKKFTGYHEGVYVIGTELREAGKVKELWIEAEAVGEFLLNRRRCLELGCPVYLTLSRDSEADDFLRRALLVCGDCARLSVDSGEVVEIGY